MFLWNVMRTWMSDNSFNCLSICNKCSFLVSHTCLYMVYVTLLFGRCNISFRVYLHALYNLVKIGKFHVSYCPLYILLFISWHLISKNIKTNWHMTRFIFMLQMGTSSVSICRSWPCHKSCDQTRKGYTHEGRTHKMKYFINVGWLVMYFRSDASTSNYSNIISWIMITHDLNDFALW